MKKVSLLLCLFMVATLFVSAQENSGVSTDYGRNTTFKKNGFWSNWFIGAGAGATMFIGPEDQHVGFFDRFTVNPSLYVGTWVNPYLGFRVRAQAGKVHTFASRGENTESMHMESMLLGNAHVDVMWNVTNYLCRYNESRVYNFIPTLGFGYVQRDKEGAFFRKGASGWSINASLLNTFRLGKRVNFFVEISGALMEGPQYDATPYFENSKRWVPTVTGTAGLQFNLGKTNFEEAVLMDQGLVDDLNRQINDLRAQNAQLSKRPVSCPDCPPAPKCPPTVETDVVVPNVVFFRLNSAVIDRNQEINIYNTAEYLKANSGAKVKIVGYADKETGTADYNMKLSEKRAKTVAKALIEKYNISSDRVQVEWKGSSEQPYKENAWNRVAIFFAE
ncbi:MAG: OmpA family protein [Dysgonomonas sp.]